MTCARDCPAGRGRERDKESRPASTSTSPVTAMAKGRKSGGGAEGLLGLPTHQSRRHLKNGRKSRSILATYTIRAAVLYALYWILYACPSTIDVNAPAVCRRFNSLKEFTVKHAGPHVQPYYEQYAGPYVAKGEQYYAQVHKVYQKQAKPAVDHAGKLYNKHLHPVTAQATQAAKKHYNARLDPVVSKYQKKAQQVYGQYVGKHIATATNTIKPYTDMASTKSQQVYDKVLVPTFHKVSPHVKHAAAIGASTYWQHGHPIVLKLRDALLAFYRTTVLPPMRRAFYKYVEPQLARVSQKLFEFKAARGFARPDVDSANIIAASVSASMLAKNTPSAKLETTVIAGETITAKAPEATNDAKLQKKMDAEVLGQVLTAAEESLKAEGEAAADVLQEKLQNLLPTAIKTQSVLTSDYLLQLENTAVEQVEAVERQILSYAGNSANHGKPQSEITEQLRPAFAKAGKKLHEQAVEVKAHTSSVLEALEQRVQKHTFIVYEGVAKSALAAKEAAHELIGYDSESVSRKHRKQFEHLDTQLADIEKSLKKLAQKEFDASAKELKALLKETDSKVQKLAGGAASKLEQLHSIGPKKITLGEDSESFGYGYVPVNAMLGAQAFYESLSSFVAGEATTTAGIIDKAYESMEAAANAAEEMLEPEHITSVVGDAAAAASDYIKSIDTDEVAASAKSAASVASSQAAEAYKTAQSAAAAASEQAAKAAAYIPTEEIKEQVQDAAGYVAGQVSGAVVGTTQGLGEQIASKASAAVYGTPEPGVAGQVYYQIKGAAGQAGEHVENAFDAIGDKVSEIVHGTPMAVTEQIAAKASELAYGKEKLVVEKVKDGASKSFEEVKEQMLAAAEKLKAEFPHMEL
ncbi:hypothetical protein BCR37DRAFT_47442 [Protomyces lactucae-debilis]|uniref:Uncharacterized protein n=1 Tax=Protomyces lactucae-debilis TaxID=2754530 RepID=A0A1Y2FCA9_PROLT|nr:uncharacterized protein BCR37DRAFT_47442 [Protomyces lactucae-debilis]ORY81552.1 hypothetical protein BCR37DRAFT_47442 [Protomyces lactucae-debilis]